MNDKNELKIFKYRVLSDRVVVQQTLNKKVMSNAERRYPILRLSIILEGPNSDEVHRLYRLVRHILLETKCCFALLSRVLESKITYRLEII